MRQFGYVGVVLSTLGLVVAGCGSSSSGGGTGGKSGTGGATTGSGGASGTGGATGTGGAAPMFTVVKPCNAATDYVAAADNTVNFGTMANDVIYMPKCLKVTAGTTVTFKSFGTETFSEHPLEPSAARGTLVGNPITQTEDGSTMKTFTFPTPGYYAYFCKFHGFTDTGDFMAGVVWVQ